MNLGHQRLQPGSLFRVLGIELSFGRHFGDHDLFVGHLTIDLLVFLVDLFDLLLDLGLLLDVVLPDVQLAALGGVFGRFQGSYVLGGTLGGEVDG